MRIQLLYIFLILGILISFDAQAAHIVGGEVQYECTGTTTVGGVQQNTFLITIKIYRDCGVSGPNAAQSFDDPIPVTIYNGQGTQFTDIDVSLQSETAVPDNVSNPCVVVPSGLCINVGVYTRLITLPYDPFGYHISTERCCRSGGLDNLVNPGDLGATYTVFITDEAQQFCNDSPIFTSSPPVVICQGQPLFLQSNAIDPDGDSLVYSFCAISDSKNTGPPGSGQQPTTTVVAAPPYPNVPYIPPYSATNPLGGAPQVDINPQTGIITGIPTQLGEFAVGVCISEYRNGVLLSTTSRDFQYKVVACQVNVQADVEADEQIGFREFNIFNCGDTTLTITNLSTQAQFINGYEWTFDLNGSPFTSTDASPTVTFPGYGVYDVQLVVNPSAGGATCTDTAIVHVYLYEPPDIDFTYDFDSCEIGPVLFFDNSSFPVGDSAITRLWDFGDGYTISSLDSLDPSRLYADAGTYTVTLTVEDLNGCTVSHDETLTWAPTPIIDIVPSTFIGCVPLDVEFQNNSYPITGYTTDWDLGDGTTSTDASPTHTYTQAGTYTVSVVIESPLGCIAADTFPDLITLYNPPVANATSVFDSCEIGPVEFTNLSTDGDTAILRWTWDLADGSVVLDTNVIYQYTQAGSFPVELKVEDYNGCTDSTTIIVDWFPAPIIKIGQPIYDGCSPFTVIIQNNSFPINGYTTEWDLGDGTFSNEASPTNTYEDVGNYTLAVTITSPTGCVESQVFNDLVVVNPNPEADFTFSPEVISILDPTVEFTDQSNDAIAWQWAFGDGATSFQQNPAHTFSDTGSAVITLVATHPTGCQDTMIKALDVIPDFTYWLPNAFTPNEDNINDGYRGIGVNLWFQDFQMKIWNRWGEMIFETSSPFESWNGKKYNTGKWVKNGVYVAIVKITDARGQQKEYKSLVTVVR